MDQPHDHRIMELVHACSDMGADEREKFLSVECADDPEMEQEVHSLIEESGLKTIVQDIPVHFQRNLPSHYRLIKMIGSGGMGEVFLAEDTRLGRRVAIKFLNDTFKKDPDRMRRFDLEARSTSALNHPNILTIYDIGEADGVQYIVSEYVDGETLWTRLGSGRFSIPVCLEIAIQIASALKAAHKAGVVHRDLKPDNIMLRSDGSVKVLDFGLAKASGHAMSGGGANSLEAVTTSPGIILGTPRYMSPEQTRGIPLDGRSDIFSLGVIVFEMLTGSSPFGAGSTIDVISAIISKEPRQVQDFIPDPPSYLVRIIEKMLRKKPEDRYLSMDDLLSDLEEVRAELVRSTDRLRYSASSDPTWIVGKVTQPPRRFRLNYIAIIAGAAVILLLGGWWLFGSRGERVGVTSGSMRSVPITSWNSVSTEAIASASFSPDSRMIAFASKKSGSAEIWVKPTIGGDPIQVTKNGFENQYPVWSPDGQEIAFRSVRAGVHGIWRISFIGGPETQIVTGVSQYARPIRWSSDRKVYFQDGFELFTADAVSGQRKQLTDFEAAGVRPRTITVSNDGSQLAISVLENGVWNVKTKSLDGVSFAVIASQKDPIDAITFHPNSATVFYSGVTDGTMQIFETIEGDAEPVQISNGNSDFFLQDVATDGPMVLYSSVSESSDLWMTDTEDKKESVIANDVPGEYWADFSPDGKSVAYQSVTRPDMPFHGSIVVKSPLVSEARVMVAHDGISPVWSNDGQWIAFMRQNDAGMSIWKVRSTGADAAKLVDGGELGFLNTPYLKTGTNHISWSSDGRTLSYSTQKDGVSNIWIVSSDGTESRPLSANADPSEIYCCSSWTHDGKHLTYVSQASKSYRLWLAGTDGREARVIFESKDRFRFLGVEPGAGDAVIAQKADTNDLSQTPKLTYIYLVSLLTGKEVRKVNELQNAYFHNIHLSRDGQAIAFVSRSNDINELWTVPSLGGIPRKVVSEKDPKVMFSSLAWSPDGRSIIFGKQTRTNLLSMLTN